MTETPVFALLMCDFVWSDGFVSKRRTILVVILGVQAFGAIVRADMMPVSPSGAGYGGPLQSPAAVATPGESVFVSLDGGNIPDFPSLPIPSLPAANDGVEQTCATEAAPILTDGQDSFGLCLYALLGLGLCRSLPLVKKVSFGYIPQWYHDGGPAQVGHSFAISPDCLWSDPVCFVQPDCPAENPIPRYHFPTAVSRRRSSQFTPALRASRAPPRSEASRAQTRS